MNEDFVYGVSEIMKFTPLEIVLFGALTVVTVVFWKFVSQTVHKMIEAIHKLDKTVENNTQALTGVRDELARKLHKTIKK